MHGAFQEAATLSPIAFWFLRHGETDWNAQGISQGNVDIPLNAVGVAQARAAADKLRNRGIRNLIFVGVTTECCVHTSIREASDRGFDNLLLSDCTSAVTRELKEAAIAIIRNPFTLFGTVGTSDAVIHALSSTGVTTG